jgi:hypothetical protein
MILDFFGFEQGSVDVIPAVDRTGDITVNTDAAKTGSYSLDCRISSYGHSNFRVHLSPTRNELYVSFWFLVTETTWPAWQYGIYIRAYLTDGNYAAVVSDASHYMDAYRQTTKVADGSIVMDGDGWHHIQAHFIIDNTTGEINTKVNGDIDVEFVGDTQPGSSTSISYIQIGCDHNAPNAAAIRVDNLVLRDDDWSGDCRVYGSLPNAAGDSTDWDPSAGANYQCVDERPPDDDTSYITSVTSGSTDLYNYADPSLTGEVQAINIWTRAKELTAGDSKINQAIRSGGGTHYGPDQTVGVGYEYSNKIWQLDPATSGSWNLGGLADLQFGVRDNT